MRNLTVLNGSSHPRLGEDICKRLGIAPGRVTLRKFANQETNVEIGESVRGAEVYIVQSGCGNVNDNFMELLILIAACRTASATKITAVIPSFPYGRQPGATDRKNGTFLTRLGPEDVDKYKGMYGGVLPQTPEPQFFDPPRSQPTPLKFALKKQMSKSQSSIPESAVASALSTSPSEDLSLGTSPQKPRSIQTRTESVPSIDGLKDTTRVSTISISQSNIVVTPLTVPKEKQQSAALVFPTMGTNSASPAAEANGYKHWTARSGTLIANLLVTAGADHVDNLYSQPLILKHIKENIPKYERAVIVSPDAGGAKRATSIADKLNMEFALIHKERRRKTQSRSMSVSNLTGPAATANPVFVSDMMIVGDVKDRVCILIDDIADTSITITQAAKILQQSGATKIYAIITHAMMSGDALDRINESPIDEVIVSNTIPQEEHMKKCSKIRVFDVAPLFAEAIRRIHNGESISFLF
ncbi:ribose-phosphate pyrophosphokinase [Entophlyctis sp. JEL0112]|nr:ribose-phosphate pyrophosphokinase [Entophlyctis sp. JEL0112]